MELELRYKKEMEKYDLKESDLPEDARVGIAEINKVLGAINMIEKKGESPKPKTIQKVKTMDKWVSFEILDHVHDTSKNTDDSGVDVDEVIEEIEEQVDDNEGGSDNADELGSKVAVELKKLSESGKDTFTIERNQISRQKRL